MDNVYLGINALNHEASVSVVDNYGNILFSSLSERFSKIKNDKYLDDQMMKYVIDTYNPNKIFWYENNSIKDIRKLITKEPNEVSPQKYIRNYTNKKLIYSNHHLSHAAAGFATSKFKESCVLVIDGIGELSCTSVWFASEKDGKCEYKLIWELLYPNSLGLFYSSLTKEIGYKPNEEEYILMGLSSFGESKFLENKLLEDLFTLKKHGKYSIKQNLHKGLIDKDYLLDQKIENIAYGTQKCFETVFEHILKNIREISDNLVYVGGCALNCVANRLIPNYFKNIWIMPNPGDAGLSLGCIAASTKIKLNWEGPFLGHNVLGEYPIKDAVDILKEQKIVGICKGKSEFGPRSLGNRSLFADPRDKNIKRLMNNIKKRENFRPFAPVIKLENYKKYFNALVEESPYMQYTMECKFPLEYPSICHVDNTSRVQTVSKKDHEDLWNLLDLWEKETNCPMLLNTSLNIKGKPMLNDQDDMKTFEERYEVKVI